jgi:hypothetical protein
MYNRVTLRIDGGEEGAMRSHAVCIKVTWEQDA